MDFKLFTQNFLTYMGLDVKSYNLKNSFNFRLKHFLDLKQIDCVLDVVANSGQFAQNLKELVIKDK